MNIKTQFQFKINRPTISRNKIKIKSCIPVTTWGNQTNKSSIRSWTRWTHHRRLSSHRSLDMPQTNISNPKKASIHRRCRRPELICKAHRILMFRPITLKISNKCKEALYCQILQQSNFNRHLRSTQAPCTTACLKDLYPSNFSHTYQTITR